MKAIQILMIEDNPGDVVLVREALKKARLGHQITVAKDGVEATGILWREDTAAEVPTPDLIILDLKLPRKSGRELLKEILENQDLSAIPLVVLSSSRSELELARAQGLPAGSYRVKPNTFEEYVELVQSIEAYRLEALAGGEAPK